jgi:hypothetical protein
MRFVDTNIFIRYVTSDDLEAGTIAADIIRRVWEG